MKKKPTTLARPGRPSLFNKQTAAAICERIAAGESLRSICASKSMPCCSTVQRWLAENEDFQRAMRLARDLQADTLAEQIIELADSATPETAHAVRLQVDARRWYASKLRPKKYGDRIEVDADTPPVIRVTIGGDA